MSVQVDMTVAQGDVVNVTLHPDNGQEMVVEAIVWHARKVRMRRSGTTSYRLGLILSNAPDAYLELLEAKEPAPRAAPKPKASSKTKTALRTSSGVTGDASKPDPVQQTPPKPNRFRVRVKQETNPRTRSILVFAQCEDEARTSALEETGSGWMILEIDQA
jgi:hypothetical protein